jgi:hypothetical protein
MILERGTKYMTDKEKQREYNRKYREANKEKFKEYSKKYREKHAEKLKEVWRLNAKRYYQENLEECRLKNKERGRANYIKNKQKILKQNSDWQKTNPDKMRAYRRKWIENNKEKNAQSKKDWVNNNPKKYKESRKKEADRRRSDPHLKIKHVVSALMRVALKKQSVSKTTKTATLLGCSVQEYKLYLENLFESWMTWDNHGSHRPDGVRRWNIDHIVPLSHFDLTDPEKQKVAFHYTNTRPLEAFKNISEGNRRPRPERHKEHD